MVKWLISVLAVVAVASAGYSGPQGPQAPVLPKGNVATVFLPEVQQAPAVQPVFQSHNDYQQPAQTQPILPKPQQTYVPQVEIQQQQPAPPQPQQIVPQQQSYAAAPVPQQQARPTPSYVQPAQQSFAPAPAPVSGYDRQRQFTPYGPAPAPVQQAPPKETYCQQNNLVEGYHSPRCSQFYFACFPLDTIRVTCPAGLYYDAEVGQCDYKHLIAACGGRRPPAQTEPLHPYGRPQQQPLAPQAPTYAQPQPQQQPPAPQAPTYAQPQPQQQPPAPQAPTYAQPQPQQQPPAPQAPTYAQPQPQQQPPAPRNPYANVQQTPPKPVETFCRDRSLSDGFYGKGCSSQFYVCALEQTTRLDCPAGLFYDQETNECGHKAVIVACGGQKPTQPPALQPPMSGPYGQPQVAKQPPPPPPPEFDCFARKDGIYIRGCSTRYFVCIQGTVMPLSCPTGTFYSAFTEVCDYKANVVECGGIAPTKTPIAQNPVMIPQSPYGRGPQQPAEQPPAGSQTAYGQNSQAQQEPAKSNNPCAALSNGIYGRKCSRFFFVCATQKTYDFICPKDHAFNLKTVKCAPKVEITTCPEFETPPAPIQQAPPQPIEIQPQPAPQAQTYAQPQPQRQPPTPQAPTYAQPQPQRQPPTPQAPTYVQPALQPVQQPVQSTYQRPLVQQQPQVPHGSRQQY